MASTALSWSSSYWLQNFGRKLNEPSIVSDKRMVSAVVAQKKAKKTRKVLHKGSPTED